MAGRGGIGEGDLPPYRIEECGDPGAFELNEDRRDDGPPAALVEGFWEADMGGGGNIPLVTAVALKEGVDVTDVAGVSGALLLVESSIMADSTSLALDSLRKIFGRLCCPCALGVRVWRLLLGMRVLRPTAWASNSPFLVEIR
jgi:hypothetical protein